MKFIHALSATLLCLTSFLSLAAASEAISKDPESARPLGSGEEVPSVRLETVSGAPIKLAEHLRGQPTVLIFYRGGWCPYCNRHLSEIQSIAPDLRELGYRIVAISPDRPEVLSKTTADQGLDYELLSDRKATAIRAFGLAFQMEQTQVDRYRERFGIDIEKDSGETHHLLPVPALYLVDAKGRIDFRFFDPNYKKRIGAKEVLTAAESMQK